MTESEMVHTLLARLTLVVATLAFIALNLALATLGLLALWAWQVEPQAVLDGLLQFAQSRGGILLGLAGLSLATLLGMWIRFGIRAVQTRLSRFLWRGIRESAEKSG